MMRIGVFLPNNTATSMRIYAENVMNCLSDEIVFLPFGRFSAIPRNVDLYWDPRSGNGNPPAQRLRFTNKPIVLTTHGVVLPSHYAQASEWTWREGWYLKIKSIYKLLRWIGFRTKISKMITVSKHAADTLPDAIHVNAKHINVIHHGVDQKVFYPQRESQYYSYLLHISVGWRVQKNVIRVLQAYERLKSTSKPKLRLIIAGYGGNLPLHPEGVELIRDYQSQSQLASHYRQAIAFVFPSLRESFGMPIIEAMASGCPVITSNVTAMPEIAGNAALLVDPFSVDAIAEAMKQILANDALRVDLRQRGLKRAKAFSWKESAQKHLEVFEDVMRASKHDS